jgi:hypothetical protein
MRHRAVVAVCHPFAAETDPDLGARMEDRGVPAALATSADPADHRTLVDPVVQVVPVTSVDPVVQVVQATSADPVVQVVQATSADPVVQVVQATSADPADQVVQATSADPADQVTSADQADQVTSADQADPAIGDRGPPTPSAASVAPRGVMEQRRGAGEHRRESAGAGRSPRPAEYGTKDRSTIGASRSSRYGIRAKTVGDSTSSESGSRCNQPVG